MVNKAKQSSEIDGKQFLKEALELEQNILQSKLDLSVHSVPHDPTMGAVNEAHFIELLTRYLPTRYSIDSGIILDSEGKTSDQIDVVIYDHTYTPTLLDQHHHHFIPVEAVYAIFEVKPEINKGKLEYAADKANSVRKLVRTKTPIRSISGKLIEPHEHPEIISGIIASRIKWKDNFGNTFTRHYKKLKKNYVINCGLAVSGAYFDDFEGDKEIITKEGDSCTAFFLFRLLQQLQHFGNVIPVNWNIYADLLSE